MGKLAKEEFITRSFSKLDFKRWELYVISRIYHRLNDDDIEFVFQQPVRSSPNSNPYLLDLFFPQFGLYVEINELAHSSNVAEKKDITRRESITSKRVRDEGTINSRALVERRIETYKKVNGQVTDRMLHEINQDIESLIEEIRHLKSKLINRPDTSFEPWNFEEKFSYARFLDKGYLNINERPRFRTQLDALRCFGYEGGRRQKAVWPNSPDKTGWQVWFVRCVPHKTWSNTLSEDGLILTETLLNRELESKHLKKNRKGKKITFARRTDVLNQTLYEFIGVFELIGECSRDEYDNISWRYERKETEVNLKRL